MFRVGRVERRIFTGFLPLARNSRIPSAIQSLRASSERGHSREELRCTVHSQSKGMALVETMSSNTIQRKPSYGDKVVLQFRVCRSIPRRLSSSSPSLLLLDLEKKGSPFDVGQDTTKSVSNLPKPIIIRSHRHSRFALAVDPTPICTKTNCFCGSNC